MLVTATKANIIVLVSVSFCGQFDMEKIKFNENNVLHENPFETFEDLITAYILLCSKNTPKVGIPRQWIRTLIQWNKQNCVIVRMQKKKKKERERERISIYFFSFLFKIYF